MTFCEARIREKLTLERQLQGHSYGTLPLSDQTCSREALAIDVCGVHLCDQHRRMVTYWSAGREHLRPRANRVFEEWGVTPSVPFVGEHELHPHARPYEEDPSSAA